MTYPNGYDHLACISPILQGNLAAQWHTVSRAPHRAPPKPAYLLRAPRGTPRAIEFGMPPLPRERHLSIEIHDDKILLLTDQVTRMPGQRLPTRVVLTTEMSPAVAERVADELLHAAADLRARQRVLASLAARLEGAPAPVPRARRA